MESQIFVCRHRGISIDIADLRKLEMEMSRVGPKIDRIKPSVIDQLKVSFVFNLLYDLYIRAEKDRRTRMVETELCPTDLSV
jgi:hypothetical protein